MKKIRVLTLEDNESKPCIVTFPQNHPSKRFLVADENGGDDYEEDLIEFDLYQHQHSKSKNMIYGHNTKFDWLGSNAGRNYKKVQGSKYVLGFYSDKSKHLTVMETQDVFNLKQYIKDEKVAEEEERLAPNIRAIEQKKLLVEEFGNSRSRKMMDLLKTSIVTENKISGASEIKEILMEKAEEFKKDMEEKKDDTMSVFIQSKRETLPEFDLQAEIPEKVYNLFSIIPREEWENLNTKEFHAAIKTGNNMLDRIKSHCSKFAVQELDDIRTDLGNAEKEKGEKESKSEKKRFKGKATLGSKIKCLVYLNWLLKFLEMRVVHKTVEQLCDDMKMHQSNVKSILNRFFIASTKEQDKVVYIRNTMLTDKLISYILILALIYGDFEFDATLLIATMKLEHKKFMKHCDEIGCIQKKKKQGEEEKTIMKLEAPIKFKPPPTKKPKKELIK